jgi:hypothetical protein
LIADIIYEPRKGGASAPPPPYGELDGPLGPEAASPPPATAVWPGVDTRAQSGLNCGILHFNGLEEQALLRR